MSEKVKVIILPEIHEFTDKNAAFIPILMQGIHRIGRDYPDAVVLNVSEGSKKDDFFYKLHQSGSLPNLDLVEYSGETSIEEDCFKYFHSLLIVIKNYAEEVKSIRDAGGDPSWYPGPYKMADGSPVYYSQMYIDMLLDQIYVFGKFINKIEDESKPQLQQFYLLIRSTIGPLFMMNVTNYKEMYEKGMKLFLNSAKNAFLSKGCGPIGGYFDELMTANNSLERENIINGLREKMRNYRDDKIMQKINATIQVNPQIKIVIILIGVAHYKNLKRIISESSLLQLEESQKTLDEIGFHALSLSEDVNENIFLMNLILSRAASLPPHLKGPPQVSTRRISPSAAPRFSRRVYNEGEYPELDDVVSSKNVLDFSKLSPSTRELLYPVGARVSLKGLSTPELNGISGTITGEFRKDATGKIIGQGVFIDGKQKPMGIKFENMDQLGGRRKRKTKANRKLNRRKSRKHKHKKKN